jgi:hypothetical protein
MREIGPLTCVIACVVWSASQSTVPVVGISAAHDAGSTRARPIWPSWRDATVK